MLCVFGLFRIKKDCFIILSPDFKMIINANSALTLFRYYYYLCVLIDVSLNQFLTDLSGLPGWPRVRLERRQKSWAGGRLQCMFHENISRRSSLDDKIVYIYTVRYSVSKLSHLASKPSGSRWARRLARSAFCAMTVERSGMRWQTNVQYWVLKKTWFVKRAYQGATDRCSSGERRERHIQT